MFEKLNNHLINLMVRTNFGMPTIVEAFLMLLAFWWGFILLMPHDTFAISQAYASMGLLMGESLWGCYFLILGVIQWFGLLRKGRKSSMTGLMLATVTWLFIGSLLLAGSFASTGAGTYLLISLLSASTYFFKGVEKA